MNHLIQLYAKQSPKKVFHTSNEALAEIAVGRKNDPYFDSKILKPICPGSISSPLLQEMKHNEEIKYIEKEKRKRPYDKKLKNETRTQSRQLNQNDQGDYKEKK